MISLDFVTRLSSVLGVKATHMVERDVILHQILTDMSNDRFFSKNFLFKGGTCLIKQHLGYFRFSEDADFTWRDQSRFKNKTAKEIRKALSATIDVIGSLLEKISAARGFDFKCSNNDANYVEIGGSNKMCTFKMWHHSAVLKKKSFIKIQITFVEEMCTKPKKGQLKSLIRDNDEDLKALFPEYLEYSKTIPFGVYDAREILSEKIRALITRKGIKTRDFVDIFFIQKEIGIKPTDVENCVIKKTNHVINLYAKYRDNLKAKEKLLQKGAIFDWGAESELLLTEVNEKEFQKFVNALTQYARELIKKLL